MQKSKLTPDPIRDAPEGHGEGQSPGPYSALPGRSTRDTRFARFPMTFFILAYCCSHAKSYSATFWVNQRTISNDLNISQQAISQHFRKLVDWGYIEKLRNQDCRRKYGKKGAMWRVVYDPTMTWKDVEAMSQRLPKTEEEEQEAIQDTINQAAKGAKGQQSKRKKQPVDNSVSSDATTSSSLLKERSNDKPQLVRTDKVQLVNNNTTRTMMLEVNKNDCRRLCISYAHMVDQRWGSGFRHDLRQEELAGQLLSMGYTVDSFVRDAEAFLDYLIKNNKQPIGSLQYFVTRKQKKDKPIDAEGLVKKLTASMKMP